MIVRGFVMTPGRRVRCAVAGLFCAVAPFLAPAPAGSEAGQRLQAEAVREPLVIATAAGARHAFRVELADDAAERAQGLMFRTHLAADAGMLFRFPGEMLVAFWMKNTLLSLDILFLRADGRIVRIAERTTPLSLEPIRSGAPVLAVLEVPAGTSARLGLKPGDRVEHAIFQSAPRDP